MFGAPRFTESVNFNPPQFHLLVLPLARVDLWPALLLWQLASLAAGCVSAAIVIRTLRPGWSPLVTCVTAALILNSAALSSTLWFGQMSLLPLGSRHSRLARVAAGTLERASAHGSDSPAASNHSSSSSFPTSCSSASGKRASGAAPHGRRALPSAPPCSARPRCSSGSMPDAGRPGWTTSTTRRSRPTSHDCGGSGRDRRSRRLAPLSASPRLSGSPATATPTPRGPSSWPARSSGRRSAGSTTSGSCSRRLPPFWRKAESRMLSGRSRSRSSGPSPRETSASPARSSTGRFNRSISGACSASCSILCSSTLRPPADAHTQT